MWMGGALIGHVRWYSTHMPDPKRVGSKSVVSARPVIEALPIPHQRPRTLLRVFLLFYFIFFVKKESIVQRKPQREDVEDLKDSPTGA